MSRRASSFYDRASVLVTNQVRGVPFQWFSIVLAVAFIIYGIRDTFFCGQAWYPFEGDREFVAKLKCDDFDGLVTRFAAVGLLFNGVARLSFATTDHVEDLFRISVMMFLWDAVLAYLTFTMDHLYIQFALLIACSVAYEAVVAYSAWVALQKRSARKSA